jgi:hypothetical protein
MSFPGPSSVPCPLAFYAHRTDTALSKSTMISAAAELRLGNGRAPLRFGALVRGAAPYPALRLSSGKRAETSASTLTG